MPRNILDAIVAVSVLAPLALVPTAASAQSVLPTFHPSTITQPRTLNQPSYAPSYAPADSGPSVRQGCAGCGVGKLPNNLSGIWSVTYPQGPLRVRVVHRGPTLVATLLDGNIAVPAGKVTVQSHGANSRIFAAEQICAYPGYLGAHFVDVRFTIADNGKYMKEDLIGSCGAGSTIEWSKVN
jgi:hypothetical protein